MENTLYHWTDTEVTYCGITPFELDKNETMLTCPAKFKLGKVPEDGELCRICEDLRIIMEMFYAHRFETEMDEIFQTAFMRLSSDITKMPKLWRAAHLCADLDMVVETHLGESYRGASKRLRDKVEQALRALGITPKRK